MTVSLSGTHVITFDIKVMVVKRAHRHVVLDSNVSTQPIS